MRFTLIISLCFGLFSFAFPLFAQDMGIVTGHKEGTYYEFGQNIKVTAKEFGVNVKIIETDGSLDNIEKMRRINGVQVGIVQADVLSHILENQNSDSGLQDYVKRLRIVYPLYLNEVHILADINIDSFEKLQGKKVAIGSPNSGTNLTSTFLFNLAGIKPSKELEIGAREALEKLKNGEIDAMIYVAGQPVKLFSDGDLDGERQHFIPITSENIVNFYRKSTIKSSNYPWMRGDIPTVAVESVLMSFNFQNENCSNVRKLAHIIRDNIECLKQTGHSKWSDVKFDGFSVRGWERYACVHENPSQGRTYKLQNCTLPTKASPVISYNDCLQTCKRENSGNPTRLSLCPMRCSP